MIFLVKSRSKMAEETGSKFDRLLFLFATAPALGQPSSCL
jgi:hypothetical protein